MHTSLLPGILVIVLGGIAGTGAEISVDYVPAEDPHIDFEGNYWEERNKLVKVGVGKYGETIEQYLDPNEEYDDVYPEDFFDEKEEAFESLPDHVKIDYLGEDYESQELDHRELTGKLGRGYLESLCGRDEGKPCASTNFGELHCANYGKGCAMDSWDCQTFDGVEECIVSQVSVDVYRLYDEPLYVNTLRSQHNITFENIEPFVDLSNAPCVGWSDYFGSNTSFPEGVTIPPATCITMREFTNNEVLEFGDVINVIGKWVFPDGTRVTLKFPMMYVQGLLRMISTAVIDNDPEITFELNEPFTAPDRHFVPYGENEWICPAGGCIVGKNGIVVAGGKIDIRGMPPNCPVWSKIEYIEADDMVSVPAEVIPQQSPLPVNTTIPCSDKVVIETFAGGMGKFYGSPGTGEEITSVGHTDDYLKISNRKATWMGAVIELRPEEKECMLADDMYFFSANIRLSRSDGAATNCATDHTNCPTLSFSNMNAKDQVRWYTLASLQTDVEVVDGEWFLMTAEVYFTELQLATDDIFSALYLTGPEEGVDMDIDNFKLQLPPTFLYPPLVNTCENLIVNGKGDLMPGFTFPMTSWLKAEKLVIKYDENDNSYFHLGPRHEEYSTITFDMLPHCLDDTVQYKFKTRIWVHSEEPVRPRAVMKVHHERNKFPKPYHRNFHFDVITICDETSNSIGWITCEETVEFEYFHIGSTRIQFLFLTEGSTADVSYADMEFIHLKGKQTGGLKLPEEIHGCWGAGPNAFITSEEIIWDKDKVRPITNVREDGMLFLDIDEEFEMPSSIEEQGIYSPEVALMRRNILFTAPKDPDDPYFGGFFLILKSPTGHTIEGLEIQNFGQQRNVAKYPINIYHGGSHMGTRISKNYIAQSNLRGITITGTSHVNITTNVFYNISGHGIVMEEGSEMYNYIEYNMGARFIPIIIENNWWYQEQDDRARFLMIKNPKNHFIGNVGTGGFWSAIWFQLHNSFHGESRKLFPPQNPRKLPILTFRDNVAHSNRKSGIQFHPTYYWPNTQQYLYNTISYRNMWFGIYFFGTEHVTLDGGLVADNRIGIDLNYVDKVEVANFEVVGYSDLFKDYIDSTKKKHLCWEFEDASPAIHGIRIHPNLMDHFHDWGVKLTNITFDRLYDDNGCPGSKAIVMNPIFKDEIYSNKIAFFNLTFNDENEIFDKFNMCDGEDAGLLDVNIFDSGDLNPEGREAGSGWIVSRDTNMTRLRESCVPMEGSCAYYCKGKLTCMTKVTSEIEFSDTEDYILLVEDQDNYVRKIDGFRYLGISEEQSTTNWVARRHFAVTLPEGNYTASFWKDGEMVWPGFVEADIVGNWLCKDEMNSFEFIIPDPEPGYCDTLIHNGDMEKSNDIGVSEWHDTGGGLAYMSPGHNSNQAIVNLDRKKLLYGFAHFADDRCLVVGERWLVTGWIKMSNNDECDFLSVSKRLTPMCPRWSIKTQTGRGVTAETSMVFMGRTVPPYKVSEWNLVVGTFMVNEFLMSGNSTAIFMDGPPPPALIYLDDVTTTKFPQDCSVGSNLVINGEIDGDLRFWKYTGPINRHRTGIELADNAEKGWGEGYSMLTTNRDQEWHGLKQDLLMDCFEVGNEYEVKVRYRVIEAWGDLVDCDPFLAYVLPDACPRPRLTWVTGDHWTDQYFMDIGYPVGPNKSGEWHESYGIFTFTEHHMEAADKQIEVFFGKNWPHKNIVVDSYSVSLAPPNLLGSPSRCDPLVVNGDAELGNARDWYIKGKEKYGTIEMVSPGRGGSGYAFHHFGDRAAMYNGMWKKLNKSCISVGRYKVTAYFKLFDSSGNEIGCDKSRRSGPTRCPQLFFQAHTPGETVVHKGPSWNRAPGGWNIGDWNKYESIFTLTQEFYDMYEIWFYVHNVLPGNGYYFDDVSMVRL